MQCGPPARPPELAAVDAHHHPLARPPISARALRGVRSAACEHLERPQVIAPAPCAAPGRRRSARAGVSSAASAASVRSLRSYETATPGPHRERRCRRRTTARGAGRCGGRPPPAISVSGRPGRERRRAIASPKRPAGRKATGASGSQARSQEKTGISSRAPGKVSGGYARARPSSIEREDGVEVHHRAAGRHLHGAELGEGEGLGALAGGASAGRGRAPSRRAGVVRSLRPTSTVPRVERHHVAALDEQIAGHGLDRGARRAAAPMGRLHVVGRRPPRPSACSKRKRARAGSFHRAGLAMDERKAPPPRTNW